jgi:hypothetical protein
VHGTKILMGSCALLLLVSASTYLAVALLLLSSEPNQQTANSRRQVAEMPGELAPNAK